MSTSKSDAGKRDLGGEEKEREKKELELYNPKRTENLIERLTTIIHKGAKKKSHTSKKM